MLIYNYNPITFEYIDSSEATLDPMATKREGKDIWLVPAHATLLKPPKTTKYKTTIFENETWVVKDDYRGEYICNEALDVIYVEKIGPLPEGYIRITEKQAEQIAKDPLWYIVKDGKLIKNPDYDKQKEEKEKERVSHLKCTKRVFVLMLEQMGLDYFEQILPLIKANRQAELEWDLCVELERTNPLLDSMGAKLGVTPEQIDNLFKYANGEITQEEFLNDK